MMKIGTDTWYLLLLAEQNAAAKKLFKQVVDGQHELFVSTLSITEITTVLLRKGQLELAEKLTLHLVILPNVHIISYDLDIAKETAKRKHSLGLSLADAGILTTALTKNCEVFIAEDSDYESAKRTGVIRIVKPADIV